MDIFRKKFLDGLMGSGKKEFMIRDIKLEARRFRITSKDAISLCGELEKSGHLKSFGNRGYKRFRVNI